MKSQVTMARAAEILGEGPKKLPKKLRDAGVLINGGSMHNAPTEAYIHHGYFNVEIVNYMRGEVPHQALKTYVTGKGISFLRGLLDNINNRELKHVSEKLDSQRNGHNIRNQPDEAKNKNNNLKPTTSKSATKPCWSNQGSRTNAI